MSSVPIMLPASYQPVSLAEGSLKDHHLLAVAHRDHSSFTTLDMHFPNLQDIFSLLYLSFPKPTSRPKSTRSPSSSIKIISLDNVGQTNLLKNQLSNTVSLSHYSSALSFCESVGDVDVPLKSSVPRLKRRTITGPL